MIFPRRLNRIRDPAKRRRALASMKPRQVRQVAAPGVLSELMASGAPVKTKLAALAAMDERTLAGHLVDATRRRDAAADPPVEGVPFISTHLGVGYIVRRIAGADALGQLLDAILTIEVSGRVDIDTYTRLFFPAVRCIVAHLGEEGLCMVLLGKAPVRHATLFMEMISDLKYLAALERHPDPDIRAAAILRSEALSNHEEDPCLKANTP
ncbi:MAG: hypothetical protein GXY32_04320 [Ruminococcaceae bacterium]|nr:hypothetical protein [Oscillospiraceae bacterium]